MALIAIDERTTGKLSPRGREFMARLPADFRAAVAFYPGMCDARFQAWTYQPGETEGWTSHIPLLVLAGDADVWTPVAPCKEFLDAAIARGNPIALQVYPGAVHAFDLPNQKRFELPQYRTFAGDVPVLQTDPVARADAFRRVPEFLAGKLRD